jgi:2-methylisocitrate lyase-like PEP mutase family enzyme
MSEPLRKAELFKGLHIPGRPLVLFNVWDTASTRAVAAGGSQAIATSSWSVAHANGSADGEHLPLATTIETLTRIVAVTELPVTVDLESGYGQTSEAVAKTIGFAISAGAVGCNLEDSIPSKGRLRELHEQVARIRSARRSAEALRTAFFINARTDVFLQFPAAQHDETLVTEVLERAHAYADAGADGLFAPGLTDLRLIARLAGAAALPLNIMVEEGTAPLRALAEHGVARVSHGPRPYLLAMRALEEAARIAFR